MKITNLFTRKIMVLLAGLIMLSTTLFSQNVTITDDDGYTAESSAMLDVNSDSKGLLFPRLTTAQIATLTSTAVEGLMVYNTDLSTFFYYDGEDWVPMNANFDGMSVGMESPLFSVVNTEGDTVFAVYNEGVTINVGDGDTKGNRGGFAVGGLSGGKSNEQYFRVYRDSVRVNINDVTKAERGGFAVGGLSGKGATDYFSVVKDNYLIGYQSGLNATGTNNTFFGYEAGKSNTFGASNVFLGYRAGYSNTTGNNNIIIGTNSGTKNIGGWGNIFLGNHAGDSLETGFRNIFIGTYTGFLGTESEDNVFIGGYSGYSINDGRYNTFIGHQSGEDNTDGSYNTFIGYGAGDENTTSYYNTFVGCFSGNNAITGSRNTFLGYQTGRSTTASNNVFIGYISGYANTSGTDNVFMGYYSGFTSSTGDRNTIIGSEAGRNNGIGENNTFLGYKAGNGNSDGMQNVYIGSMCASQDTLGSENVMIGYQAGFGQSTGCTGNVFIGYQAGYHEDGDDKLYIENSQANPLIYGDFASNYVVINGINNNSFNFYVTGSAGGYYDWNSLSKTQLKTNIKPIHNALDRISKLEGIQYEWIDKSEPGTRIGLIAEDVEKIIPEVINKTEDSYFIQYGPLSAIFVEAIKEQQTIIEKQNQKIEALEKRLEALEK
jgi:hypothetical protein